MTKWICDGYAGCDKFLSGRRKESRELGTAQSHTRYERLMKRLAEDGGDGHGSGQGCLGQCQ